MSRWITFLLWTLLLSSSLSAQEPPAEKEPPENEREQAEADEDEDEASIFHWDNGAFFQANRWNFRTKVGGQAQNDTAGFATPGTASVELSNGVEWRRARLYAAGSFGRFWTYRFQWDFTGGRGPNLTDAWLSLTFHLWQQELRFRSGRFSSTFGLENDASSNDTLFMEQGLTSAFVPPQETGVLVHSQSGRRRWDFSFSSAAEELQCLICSVSGISGRYSTSFHLGKDKARILHLGFDYSRRWTDDAVNFAERPESHIAPVFVDTGPIAAERVDTALIEWAYLAGPFSMQSEYALARVKRPESETPLFNGGYISVGYTLTGESRPYNESEGTIGRVVPKEVFRDGSGSVGALQVAFRLSHLDLDDQNITGGKLTDYSVGFNWYPTNQTRFAFNIIRAKRSTWDPVWIFQGRLQLAF